MWTFILCRLVILRAIRFSCGIIWATSRSFTCLSCSFWGYLIFIFSAALWTRWTSPFPWCFLHSSPWYWWTMCPSLYLSFRTHSQVSQTFLSRKYFMILVSRFSRETISRCCQLLTGVSLWFLSRGHCLFWAFSTRTCTSLGTWASRLSRSISVLSKSSG